MITANEARKKIDALATKRGEEEKLNIDARIIKAVENGDSSCFLGFCVSDSAKKWLEALGYQVRIISDLRGADTEVEW